MKLPTALLRWRPLRSTTAVLVLSGVVTLCLVVVAGAVMLLARADATREADKDALNIARAAGQDIARNLALYDLSLQTVVRQLAVPGVMALDPELRQSLLFDGASRGRHFGFINAIDEKGTVIADSASQTPRGGNFASRDYFRAQRETDTLYIGKPFLTDPGQPTMIAISRRMAHRDGSFAGVVVGSMRIAYFAELFSRFAIGTHGTMTLLREDGMILQRMPAAPGQIGAIPQNRPLPDVKPPVPSDMADPVDRRLRRMVSYPIDGLPLIVAVGLAPEDIYAAWRGKAAMIAASVAALGGLNTGLLLWLRWALRNKEAADAALRRQGRDLIELAQQRAEALAADKQAQDRRAERLADVSHDMRTLLHGMLGNTELIRHKGTLNPDQAHCVDSVRTAGEHLRDVADRFVRESRIENGAAGVTLRPTDIRAVIEQCRSMVSLSAEDKGLRLVLEADPALPKLVITDGTRLAVILWNLLDNAIKYTDQGSVALRVSQEPVGLRFVIVDTGRGMPAAQARRLLQDRVPPGGHDDAAGLGLGIVQRRTRELGGTISCMRNPGGGSIICLELPVAAARESEPRSEAACAAMPSLRVLVVDDSAITRVATAELLQAAGHRVTQVRSGERAVRQAGEEIFDVVLMDMRMQGMHGLDAARHIRALPGRHGRTPIIAVTAELAAAERAAWQAAGIDDYLGKPCDQAQLLHAIRRVTATREAGIPRPESLPRQTAPQRHLRMLSQELHAMLSLLDTPARDLDSGALDALVHRIAGDSAQLGFAAVATECRRFEQAIRTVADRPAPHDALTQATRAAIAELRQRLQDPRNGEARSAMPV